MAATESTVTYTSKKQLGDCIVYTFTFTSIEAEDWAYVMGRDGDGFLVSNMNDRQVTIEIDTNAGTPADVEWYIQVLGNHEADSDESNWLALTVAQANLLENAVRDFITFAFADLSNHPYLGFKLTGKAANEAAQTVVVRVYFDFDGKYVGKE